MQVRNYSILSGMEMYSLNKTKNSITSKTSPTSSFNVSCLKKDFRNRPQWAETMYCLKPIMNKKKSVNKAMHKYLKYKLSFKD